MKLVLIILAHLLIADNSGHTVQKWVIGKNSKLSIEGSTNINSFRCDVTECVQQDTITFLSDSQKPLIIDGGLTINIRCFDCHQKHITEDLRETLKAGKIPTMQIRLLKLDYFTTEYPGEKTINGVVEIQLAGVTRQMPIQYVIRIKDEKNILLIGHKKVHFSDFSLKPPRKLAGLIKVEDAIKVKFQLVLRMV